MLVPGFLFVEVFVGQGCCDPGASEMDRDEAVSNVIPSGMEYWSETCCCRGSLTRNTKVRGVLSVGWVFFPPSLPFIYFF